MYRRFFVFVTEQYYGVFAIDAVTYPEEMFEDMAGVSVRYFDEVEPYLLECVGRNELVRGRFSFPYSIGRLHYRKKKEGN